MACTIDHLRVDHHVTVLRDFTDLGGITVRAGETGRLRGLGADFGQMEIWMELERRGAPERLRFALRATEGPRNGHMREYFEMGEEISPTPVRPAKPAPPAPREERESAPAGLESYGPKEVSNDMSLGELRVACRCAPAFHRELWPARGELSVYGCLGCGTVTCSRSFGDDGRFTGQAWQEIWAVALPERVHRWIAGWPRVKMDYAGHARWPMSADLVRYPTLFYPADTRCDDLAELAELEAKLTQEQAGQSRAARLRATHRVRSAPPTGVPPDLQGYGLLWEALQLRPKSDLSDLLYHAQLRSPGCEVAAEVVRQRPDAFEIMVQSLQSEEATRRGAGFAIARDARPVDPRLAGVLIELMNRFSFDPLPDVPEGIVSRGRFEMIFLLIAELKLATPEMLSALRALMRKLAYHDPFLVDCVRNVLRELSGGEQGTVSPRMTPFLP